MQANQLQGGVVFKMTAHGVADPCVKLPGAGGLSEDRFADCARGVSTFGRFFYKKYDLALRRPRLNGAFYRRNIIAVTGNRSRELTFIAAPRH